jgi:hypothetical protein
LNEIDKKIEKLEYALVFLLFAGPYGSVETIFLARLDFYFFKGYSYGYAHDSAMVILLLAKTYGYWTQPSANGHSEYLQLRWLAVYWQIYRCLVVLWSTCFIFQWLIVVSTLHDL